MRGTNTPRRRWMPRCAQMAPQEEEKRCVRFRSGTTFESMRSDNRAPPCETWTRTWHWRLGTNEKSTVTHMLSMMFAGPLTSYSEYITQVMLWQWRLNFFSIFGQNWCAFRPKIPNYLLFNVVCISTFCSLCACFCFRQNCKTAWKKSEFKVLVSVRITRCAPNCCETPEIYVKVFQNNKWHKGLQRKNFIFSLGGRHSKYGVHCVQFTWVDNKKNEMANGFNESLVVSGLRSKIHFVERKYTGASSLYSFVAWQSSHRCEKRHPKKKTKRNRPLSCVTRIIGNSFVSRVRASSFVPVEMFMAF